MLKLQNNEVQNDGAVKRSRRGARITDLERRGTGCRNNRVRVDRRSRVGAVHGLNDHDGVSVDTVVRQSERIVCVLRRAQALGRDLAFGVVHRGGTGSGGAGTDVTNVDRGHWIRSPR